jgi:chemotaxis response regulator CheB
MLVLCVARHPYISEHLARVLHGAGVDVRAAVGIEGAVAAASECQPDVIAAEYELVTSARLRRWEADATLRDTPVLAFSLTRETGDSDPLDASGIAGFFYLPRLGGERAVSVLRAAVRGRVRTPVISPLPWPQAQPQVLAR